jgi:hypothetical protein
VLMRNAALAEYNRLDGVGLDTEPSKPPAVIMSAQAGLRCNRNRPRRTTGLSICHDRASMRRAHPNPTSVS